MDFLLRHAKRCNRNLFITAMITLLIAVLLSFFPFRDYYLSFKPDKELNIQKIKASEYSLGWTSDFYYIKSEGSIDLGTDSYTVTLDLGSKTREVESEDDYVLIKCGEYWLPVRLSDNIRQSSNIYKGKLAGINDRVLEELKLRAVKIRSNEFNTELMLDSCIDTTIKSTPWTNFFFWVSCILFLIFLTSIIKVIKRAINPYKSPVFSNLSIYGNIEEIEQSINREMHFEEFSFFENVLITDNWFLSKHRYTADIVPLSQIVWVYTKAEWKRWKGIIPVYKITKLYVITKNELCYEAAFLSKTKADNIVERLKTMLPWIIVGYSKDVKKLFDSDFESLVSQVDNDFSLYRKVSTY